jgi:hypothetical protein
MAKRCFDGEIEGCVRGDADTAAHSNSHERDADQLKAAARRRDLRDGQRVTVPGYPNA